MRRLLIFLAVLMLSATAMAAQQGQHNGNVLNVDIEYKNFNGYMDYSYLGLGNLPVYYIGQNMNYTVSLENLKKSNYNHLVILVTHRYYPSGELTPDYQIDAFSGLPYHDIIYLDNLKTSASFDLSHWIPWAAQAGADRTDVIIYRGYDFENPDGATWSFGRIIFESTVGYFCPP